METTDEFTHSLRKLPKMIETFKELFLNKKPKYLVKKRPKALDLIGLYRKMSLDVRKLAVK